MAEQSQTAREPQAVGVVDIGSNSIRMALAEVEPDGELNVLERTQRAVHLGQDTFVSGRISTRTLNVAVGILTDFRQILDTYRVERVRAVATSSVREAANADAFLDRVYMACGLDVEVITTSEESRLKVSAVRQALRQAPQIRIHDALVVEIGGGSALLTVLEGGQITASESYRLGSIRLQESLSVQEEGPEKAAELIRQQIAGILSSIVNSLPMQKVDTFFACGGDARFVARQIGKGTESPDLHLIKPRKFDRLVDRLAGLGVGRIVREFGLSYAQAETLVPALLIYQALVHETAVKQIVASATSMRDGLLLDMAHSVVGYEDEELTRGIVRSAETICRKYRVDEGHAGHVADLALRLFDEMAPEHGLERRHRLLLRVAAMLHEVGSFVSGRAHHKHSHYLIRHAEVFGLSGDEIETVALVARYHRRSTPKQSHPEYTALPRERRVLVSKLAALLRVADAMDRGHGQQVQQFVCERRDDELVLYIPGATDLALERRAMAQKADLFEDIYGLTVRLEEAPLPAPDLGGS